MDLVIFVGGDNQAHRLAYDVFSRAVKGAEGVFESNSSIPDKFDKQSSSLLDAFEVMRFKKAKLGEKCRPQHYYVHDVQELNNINLPDLEFRFVLFYTSPEYHLTLPDFEQRFSMQEWYVSSQGILNVHLNQVERSILVNSQYAFSQPNKFLQFICDKVGVAYDTDEFCEPNEHENNDKALSLLMALYSVKDQFEVQSLFEKLESAGELVESLSDLEYERRFEALLNKCLKYGKKLQASHQIFTKQNDDMQEQLERERMQVQHLHEELEQYSMNLQKIRKENERLALAYCEQESQASNAVTQLEKMENKEKSFLLTQELDSLQIKQLQEELEYYFLKHRNSKLNIFHVDNSFDVSPRLKASLKLLKVLN